MKNSRLLIFHLFRSDNEPPRTPNPTLVGRTESTHQPCNIRSGQRGPRPQNHIGFEPNERASDIHTRSKAKISVRFPQLENLQA
jgi:hypothetical protein